MAEHAPTVTSKYKGYYDTLKPMKADSTEATNNENFVGTFFAQLLPPSRKKDESYDTFSGQRLSLVKSYPNPKKERYKRKPGAAYRRGKPLTARERKQLQIFHISKDNQSYVRYEQLNSLWKQYMKTLLGKKPEKQMKGASEKILKADFHGSIISVLKSTCPTYVGVKGIVLKESKNMFTLITKENKVKMLPKSCCVFTIEFDLFVATIYGGQICVTPSQRTAKKFKSKGTLSL